MIFKKPPPLRPGDTIGVMAPSSYVTEDDLAAGIGILKTHGYNVRIHPQTHARLHQSAGTHEQKRDALHDLAKDPSIKMVLFAGGGNRALHLLNLLDYKLIRAHPKIYMGFSDCTAVLNAITAHTGIVTYHGPILKRLEKNPELEFNLRLLEGLEKTIPLPNAYRLRDGDAKGPLIGGNLNVFRRLIGSRDLPNLKKAILFFEDTGEETSRLDAELCFLRRSGAFDKAAAIIFGQFGDLKDTGRPFGFTFEDIVAEHTRDLNIPVIMNAPFGHGGNLYIFPIGQTATLKDMQLILH